MRRTLIVCILTLGLLAVPFALAEEDAPSAKGREKAAAAKALRANHTDNETDDDNETSDHNETHAKPAWVSAFQATMKALRTSWLENASAIRESCHAAEKPGNNSTKDARTSWAHCIRDGYKSFLEQLRADRKEARMARDA